MARKSVKKETTAKKKPPKKSPAKKKTSPNKNTTTKQTKLETNKKGKLTVSQRERDEIDAVMDALWAFVEALKNSWKNARPILLAGIIIGLIGVTFSGYGQELVGVGYRAKAQGQRLELSLGFSHPIVFEIPQEVKLTATTEKGKNPLLKLESFDKQLIGQVAAKIRSLRKPEPYKGKGVLFKGEVIRRKAGKTAAK